MAMQLLHGQIYSAIQSRVSKIITFNFAIIIIYRTKLNPAFDVVHVIPHCIYRISPGPAMPHALYVCCSSCLIVRRNVVFHVRASVLFHLSRTFIGKKNRKNKKYTMCTQRTTITRPKDVYLMGI